MNEMEIIEFENLPSNKTPINSVNLNKLQTNAKEAIKNRKPTIELLTVSSATPTECNIGDKYYNTTTSKIYTATATNIWGTEGENPTSLYLYVDLEHKELYYFNGTTFVSYGGGSGGAGGDTLPIGAILPFSSDTIPNGWLLCDGSSFSATSYPELFDVIGVTYGWDDDRNPKLPDLRGRVAVGKKDATSADDTEFSSLGKTGGEKTHTLTVDEMPSHSHPLNGSTDYVGIDGTGGTAYGEMRYGNSLRWKIGQQSKGGDQPHNNLQPYIVTNYIIKAKMTVAIEGEVIQETGTASETNVYSSVAVDNKIQALKRVTLYENASGTNTTLTLNDSVANYEDIEIFYKSNDNAYSSVKVNNANNKNIVLVNMTPNTTNNVLYVKATVVKAQNNSITVVDGLEGYGSGGITTGNKNYIVKVVGYKEV